MGIELLGFGALGNLFYALGGYFKNRKEGDSFDWKYFLKTVLIGTIPPTIVLLIEMTGISVPYDVQAIASMLGPFLDKLLKIGA